MSKNNIEIIIPIEKSTNATSFFNTKNLFQQEALTKAKDLLEKNLAVAKNYNIKSFDRFHNAITILGERGTGKTSFLLNLKNSFDEKEEEIKLKEQLEFLEPLDPTLFEDKQNILVSIISLIADKINNNDEIEETETWIECLTELSDGLNLLDGIGSNFMQKDIWDDSRVILDKGLTSAHSGLGFEKNFHKFIEKSLELLEKELFILRFDDIDTSVLKGWPVLEVIRKYLTTPKIQIIISGDIHLFSKLVRLKQWENLEKLTEFENKKSLNSTIDQLEEQYLTKILKPENRIYLQSLESILKRHPDSIDIEYKEKYTSIEDVYDRIAEKIFILERDKDKETFINILLKLPIRTNIQILMSYYKNLYNKNDIKTFLDDFALIFMTNFTKFNFRYEDTFTLTSHREEVISYLIDKLIFIKNYKELTSITDLKFLRPTFKNKDLNLFLLYLNANVVYTMKNSISIIFDWYLKKFYFFKILEEQNISEELVFDYININDSLIYMSSRINGAIYTYRTKVNAYAKVYRQKRQAIKYDFEHGYDSYETLLKKNLEEHYPKEYLTIKMINDIIFNKIKIKDSSEIHLNVSIINIFSFLGNLLVFNEKNFDDNFRTLIIDKTVEQLSDNRRSDYTYNESNIDFSNIELYTELKDWIKLKYKVSAFSVQLVEEMWEEFFSREALIEEVDTVAKYLELQIFVFFNSLYRVIERHYNPNNSTYFIKSYNNAKKRFLGNIKGTKYQRIVTTGTFDFNNEEFESIDFLEYMLMCPLWKYLINYPTNSEFIFELGESETSLKSLNDYINLLPLHQGDSDENENVITTSIEDTIDLGSIAQESVDDLDESTWPNSKLTDRKIKDTIREGVKNDELDFNSITIVEEIWKIAKYKYKIKGDMYYKDRNVRIEKILNQYLEDNE